VGLLLFFFLFSQNFAKGNGERKIKEFKFGSKLVEFEVSFFFSRALAQTETTKNKNEEHGPTQHFHWGAGISLFDQGLQQ
jgi:hypothetical protein